jgi:hypothetical protein
MCFATMITINVSDTNPAVNEPVTISGTLYWWFITWNRMADAPVYLNINGTVYAQTKTDGAGNYQFIVYFTQPGTYTVYTYYPGCQSCFPCYDPCQSSQIVINVVSSAQKIANEVAFWAVVGTAAAVAVGVGLFAFGWWQQQQLLETVARTAR